MGTKGLSGITDFNEDGKKTKKNALPPALVGFLDL